MQRPIEPGRGLGKGLVNLDPADATRPKAHLMDDVTDVCPPRDVGRTPALWRYCCTLCVYNQDMTRKEWAGWIQPGTRWNRRHDGRLLRRLRAEAERSAGRQVAAVDQGSAWTGSVSSDRRPGRWRQRISEGSTASRSPGQRVNSACRAQMPSSRAS